jgi:hypothetical protein
VSQNKVKLTLKLVRISGRMPFIPALNIRSNLQGAKILLDGVDTGRVTNARFVRWKAGTYSVEKEGYNFSPETSVEEIAPHIEKTIDFIGTAQILPTEGGILHNGYIYHIFEADGELEVLADVEVDVLMVGGGGGGTMSESVYSTSGGAGGAGGLIYMTKVLTAGIYDIIIGVGGLGSASRHYSGSKGGNTEVLDSLGVGITPNHGEHPAYGGGGGIKYAGSATDGNGGSGGGISGRITNNVGYGGNALQNNIPEGIGFGNKGADRLSKFNPGGGGGGAGAAVPDKTREGGIGIDMATNYGFPTTVGANGVFAEGGYGGVWPNPTFGHGGGSDTIDGLDGSGGGGGGNCDNPGGKGGDGIVIVRYAI